MDSSIIYQYILSSLFLFWFLATVLFQFKDTPFARSIRAMDLFSLIPLWTFFAPNPGTNDYHLLYREKNVKGEKSNWIEIEINEDRKFSTCIWNPHKRGKKILNDIIQTIIPLLNEYHKSPRAIVLSVPYILLVNAVFKQKQTTDKSSCKQFLLASSNGYGKTDAPGVILLSEFHTFSQK